MNKAKLLITIIVSLLISCEKDEPFTVKEKKSVTYRSINNPSDTELVIYSTGLSDIQDATMIIAKKYGFTYWPAAGCIVSDSIAEFVYKNNEITNRILDQINGIGWRKRFKREVDISQNGISKAISLYYNFPLYPFLKVFDNIYCGGIDFIPDPIDTNYVHARMYWSEKWKNYYREETYMTYTINTQKSTFFLSDSIGKIEFIIDNRR